jgi:hypothetical protein
LIAWSQAAKAIQAFQITTTTHSITITPGSSTTITYTVLNTSGIDMPQMKYFPPPLTTITTGGTCNNFLAKNASCTVVLLLTIPATMPVGTFQLGPLGVCGFNGRICSVPNAANRIQIIVTSVITSTDSQLFSVTCAGANCTAVGTYNNGTTDVPLSYTSNNSGVSWAISTTLPPAPVGGVNAELGGVACNGANCTTVGVYTNGAVVTPLSYTSSNQGVQWATSITPPPIQGGAQLTILGGVACSGANCTTVGIFGIPVPPAPVSYTSADNGVNWVVSTTLPPPVGIVVNQLNNVACTGANCTAVGLYSNNGVNNLPLSYASADNGVHWATSTTLPPAPGGATTTQLDSVTCIGANCTTVGFYNNGVTNIPVSYTSSDSGVNWVISTTLPPAPVGGTDVELSGVACNVANCTAVGFYNNGTTNIPVSYTSSDSGANWVISVTLPPSPAGGTTVELTSVACSGANCTAVGFYNNGTAIVPLSYTSSDTGVHWVISTTLPQPPVISG